MEWILPAREVSAPKQARSIDSVRVETPLLRRIHHSADRRRGHAKRRFQLGRAHRALPGQYFTDS